MTHRSAAILALVGGALMVVGSLLPWASVGTALRSIDTAGISGDGVFTLILGAVVAVVAFLSLEDAGRYRRGVVILAALAGIAVVYLDYSSISGGIADVSSGAVRATLGPGLFVVAIGAIIALVGGFRFQRA